MRIDPLPLQDGTTIDSPARRPHCSSALTGRASCSKIFLVNFFLGVVLGAWLQIAKIFSSSLSTPHRNFPVNHQWSMTQKYAHMWQASAGPISAFCD
jgi:hypothetical protein